MMKAFAGIGSEWNALIAGLPNAHLLQTWDWAQVKAAYGWKPMPYVWDYRDGKCAAASMILKKQVLSRGLVARLCVLYAPRGPLFDPTHRPLQEQVLDNLQAFAKKQGAILLKIDPDVALGLGVPGEENAHDEEQGLHLSLELRRRGWLFSGDQVQFRNTVMVDLTASDAEMLVRMKQKTRYNIRLAEKKGVHVRVGTGMDLPALYGMYAQTSVRDGFVIREESYYRTVWKTFMSESAAANQPSAEPLIAEVDGEAVAAIFVFYFAGRAFYLYGMSREAHREKMPNYLLQWEAMRRARARGCTSYDLWGAPDEFKESDSMWGVFRFKEGLGGEVVRTLGAWDFPASPLWYKAYTQIVPRVLDVMRVRGRARTEQALG
jgi:lipid II:glycine glycyltransferase (peptidoglycan interpeptide bridge formation enzyme)